MNSAQPCFPVPNILPSPLMHASYKHRKLASVPFCTHSRAAMALRDLLRVGMIREFFRQRCLQCLLSSSNCFLRLFQEMLGVTAA